MREGKRERERMRIRIWMNRLLIGSRYMMDGWSIRWLDQKQKKNEQVDKDRSSNLGHIDIWLVRQIKKQKEMETWMDEERAER